MNIDPLWQGQEIFSLAQDITHEYYQTLEEKTVAPKELQKMESFFQGKLGKQGIGTKQALEEFASSILPYVTNISHPLYLGLINSSPLPGAIWGDFLVSLLNNNAGVAHQSPAFSAAEKEVITSFVDKLELPKSFDGMTVPGGSFANLQGILMARTAHFPKWREKGPMAIQKMPRLYVSQASHFSVTRAASVAGLGKENVVEIPCWDNGTMNFSALVKQIQADHQDGHHPFAVVATLGTTSTGAIDPLQEIAVLCQEHGLWLHVDACYGAAALLLEEFQEVRRALANADSVALDPHKWFFIPITAALILNRHPEIEQQAFEVLAPYIPATGDVPSYQRGVPTSRRCSGFTIWMALRAHGWQTIENTVAKNISLIRKLEQILQDKGFQVLPGNQLSIACVRWEQPGLTPSEQDQQQQKLTQLVSRSGQSWFATTRHQGKTWLRLCLTNLYTEERHIWQLANILEQAVAQLSQHAGSYPSR